MRYEQGAQPLYVRCVSMRRISLRVSPHFLHTPFLLYLWSWRVYFFEHFLHLLQLVHDFLLFLQHVSHPTVLPGRVTTVLVTVVVGFRPKWVFLLVVVFVVTTVRLTVLSLLRSGVMPKQLMDIVSIRVLMNKRFIILICL